MNTFAHVTAYIMTLSLIGLAFWLVKKSQYRTSALAISFSFACFITAQFNGDFLAKFWNDISLEQFVCWAFGFAFLLLAVYFAHKNSLAYAFVILLISVFSCFCGLSGVQALLKTHLLWQVTASLKSYGDKLDNYETEVANMRQNLSEQQDILKSNQVVLAKTQNDFKAQITEVRKNISNDQFSNQLAMASAENKIQNAQKDIESHYEQFSLLQSNLAIAVTNIDEQAKKLADVEYWVNNLYDKMTNETYSLKDTNNVLFISLTNQSLAMLIRLSQIPINGSVELSTVDVNSKYPNRAYVNLYRENIYLTQLYGYDTNSLTLSFHYVIDSRETNYFRQMPKLNEDVFYVPNFQRWFLKSFP